MTVLENTGENLSVGKRLIGRMINVLLRFEDMSYEQISAVLGKNRGQVKNLLHRGKQSLRELLQSEGFEY